MRITVNHFKKLTRAEADRLNASEGGWGSEPRFTRYADITMSAKLEAVIEALLMREYDIVADLEVADLDDAFEKSNTITAPWIENAEVTSLGDEYKEGARSSSVGDIFSDPDSGKYWLIEPVGFKDITHEVNGAQIARRRGEK